MSAARPPRRSEILLEILDEAELFHAPDGTAYADVEVNGHRETWMLQAPGFRGWLTRSYYRKTGVAPSNTALQEVLRTAEARARYDGVQRAVHVRVGGDNGNIYIDLADADWRAIRIDANGWSIDKRPKVRFVRHDGMLSLPTPIHGGSINKLRDFVNVKTDDEFILIVAWILAALRDVGPYPVLAASGEQGSAKSTLMEIVRALIDPNAANLRAPPRDDRDLYIAAGKAHVLAYDNLSHLPAWLSDCLARISTGGAHATRQLFANSKEVLLPAVNPIALNGITDIVNRADLADRCIFVTAERILEQNRKPKQELLEAFEAERPRILGALFDAVALGIKNLPTVASAAWPRMADFAKWATACEGAFARPGSFKAAYNHNKIEAIESLLDDDSLASAVQKLARPWAGTASEMLAELNSAVEHIHDKAKDWPKDAKALSGRLSRLAPLLRSKGIVAEKLQRSSNKRGWRLTSTKATDQPRDLASSSSSGSLIEAAVGMASDGDCAVNITEVVTGNPLKIKGGDADDARDDEPAQPSGRDAISRTAVLSNIDASHEELQERGQVTAQPASSARQAGRRIRRRLRLTEGTRSPGSRRMDRPT